MGVAQRGGNGTEREADQQTLEPVKRKVCVLAYIFAGGGKPKKHAWAKDSTPAQKTDCIAHSGQERQNTSKRRRGVEGHVPCCAAAALDTPCLGSSLTPTLLVEAGLSAGLRGRACTAWAEVSASNTTTGSLAASCVRCGFDAQHPPMVPGGIELQLLQRPVGGGERANKRKRKA